MIQDLETFLSGVDESMDYETTLSVIKGRGANQMTGIKVLMKLYGLRLDKADRIVSDSPQWISHKAGNGTIKEIFSSREEEK